MSAGMVDRISLATGKMRIKSHLAFDASRDRRADLVDRKCKMIAFKRQAASVKYQN